MPPVPNNGVVFTNLMLTKIYSIYYGIRRVRTESVVREAPPQMRSKYLQTMIVSLSGLGIGNGLALRPITSG